MCQLARRVDRTVLFANLFLLLIVSAVPFPTHVLAEYLTADDANAHIAAACYGATMTVMGIAFSLRHGSLTSPRSGCRSSAP